MFKTLNTIRAGIFKISKSFSIFQVVRFKHDLMIFSSFKTGLHFVTQMYYIIYYAEQKN
jgi:hypothetical protein